MPNATAYASMCILFILIFGLSGTVEPRAVVGQFQRMRPLLVGMFCQFAVLPLCGLAAVYILELEVQVAVPLLLTLSSPGGSYSNLLCSLANADLSLSVAMTTTSTFAAMAMLPLNTMLYLKVVLGTGGVDLPLLNLLPSLGIVVGAVAAGLSAAHCFPSKRSAFNRLGSIGGIALVALALFSPSSNSPSLSEFTAWLLWVAVTLPCVMGIVITTVLASLVPGISPPERTALGIETCFQNTSIALAVALQRPEHVEAVVVPLLYGVVDVICIGCWALCAWKLGYTYAPPSDNICHVLLDNYQPAHRGQAQIAPAEANDEAQEIPEKCPQRNTDEAAGMPGTMTCRSSSRSVTPHDVNAGDAPASSTTSAAAPSAILSGSENEDLGDTTADNSTDNPAEVVIGVLHRQASGRGRLPEVPPLCLPLDTTPWKTAAPLPGTANMSPPPTPRRPEASP
mmetsp:Transcript_82513/g.163875  ORF Transcript_82513/g.163875 Transcript_82513/m.163875 type:complete len:454 (-) Transcript_82513:87-1448(-)